ncbi:hypothetical protein [Sulfurospirillum halorespirans]|uniref:Putative periplasmic protein n=1 Tax=Sulfurospirillum halorespirans DSM 13726 TaxID=1193502 RepID=A0A1D7TIH9_9BACT|nr:hypothetical protein [Sulfurospirillum halorespirans]AOO64674.1 putative periplasmic protein [Sulfurospirillum halorespirans DSM 13726]
MKYAILCSLLWLTHSIATPLSLSDEVFQEAQHILQTQQESHYDHKTVINESKGYYRVDCSSFVCHVLRKKSPLALAMLPIDVHHVHARAQNFYDYFKQLESVPNAHWMAVKTLFDLERGDIIAWKYDLSSHKKDTGHVVIVAEKPIQEEQTLYRIRVIDASKGKHANDTRAKESDGIGSGDMWFRVNEKGAPIGLYWSSKEKKERQHFIVMGRVQH